MSNEQVQFLPFHAINDFMLDEYREQVIRLVLSSNDQLPAVHQIALEKLTRKRVSIPGFRNSAKAPVNLRLKGVNESFEISPPLVAAILAAWAELHPELRQQVYDLLLAQEWEILPIDADRTKLPGFLPYWPFEQDFDGLYQAYQAAYPESAVEQDDVSLMVVWLSMRLPYHKGDVDETQDESAAAEDD
jgi:hypothetical protein